MRDKKKKITDQMVQDIQIAELSRKIFIDEKEVTIHLQNTMTGKVNGERILLDKGMIDNMINEITQSIKRNHTRYNLIPNEIIFKNSSYKKDTEKEEKQKTSTEQEIIESYLPRFTLEQIALNKKVKEQIITAIAAVRYKKKMVEEWGMSEYFAGNRAIILNFYGKPGTGKSMAAEAIAKALNKKVYHINYADLESKYVGETPKNIRKAFSSATKEDAVLIFDEADSFLGKRLSSVTQSADYGVNITRSVLLMELEKFTGIVVFTTNLIQNYDDAFKRRILLSVYFEMPDEEARIKIWKLHLNNHMPLKEVSSEILAKRYQNISGADIRDMVFFAALHTLEKELDKMDTSVFDYAYEAIQSRYQDKDADSEIKIISKETITEEEYQKETKKQEE